jgi:DNA polymerase-3 subunit beta
MKITVGKEPLLNGLQMVHGAVSARPTLPILNNCLMEAQGSKLWLTTSDIELSVRYGMEAEVARPGNTTLPARRLMSIVRELPAERVQIEVAEKNTAEITCGAACFHVPGLSADEFPPLPKMDGANAYTLEQKALKEMLQRTSYAASADETRYILNGTMMGFGGGKLLVVATDGRRLALAERETDIPQGSEAEFVVPTKAVNELLHGLKDEGSVKIAVTKTQVGFEFDDVQVVSKLIDGTYPNFRQVIPAECEQRITLEREALLTALRRVALFTSEKSSSVKMTFEKNKLKISASSPDLGDAHESLTIKYAAKPISVAFNPDFLMEPLRNLTPDEVYLELTDDLSPGVIKCDVPFVYVLMPMRIT